MTIPLPYSDHGTPNIENILREIVNICMELEEKDPKNAQCLKDNIAWLCEHIDDRDEEIKELKAELEKAKPWKHLYE